ncbi:RHS repeat-associated core domain-containing protein [Luteibacter sp. E-22]|uniref:RHS repeat domain-containing protein n=1 Tax=Luteibacter sp. E-22 TaxID=3404050 RepID=UPI003CF68E2A
MTDDSKGSIPEPATQPVPGARDFHPAETGGIHSNAYNFLSAVHTGVDPRTGMYSCTVSLPGVAANALCGPTVGLGLGFSALNPVDAGFGVGWALATTRYDTRRKRLSLSTGESFRVDTFVNDRATFTDRKLRTFDLIREGFDGDYRIVHKSGMSERLRADAGSDGVAVLREVRSPEGHAVTLEQSATNGVVKLRKVIDGTGRVLLAVDYDQDGTTVVRLQPDTARAAAFTFRFANGRLAELALPDGYGDGWSFGYEATATGLLLLTQTTVPTGGREEVVYRQGGHALPGSGNQPLNHMPVVVACRRDPGHGQPVMETRYTYSTRNYFGYGALANWLDDEDNLYRVVMPEGQRYEYTSTETQYDGIEAVRTVERTFNRFHLLTRERASQAGCVTETVTVYDEDPSISFANQKPWCQLPVEVRTRYYREDEPGRVREEVESRTYDNDGNCIVHTDPTGAREYLSYYPAGGEGDDCPADPLGFVRCLKEKRVQLPTGAEGGIKVTRHAYEVIPAVDGKGPGHLLSVYEGIHREVDGRVLAEPLSETRQMFVADGGAHHGRLRRVVSTVHGVEASTDYAYVEGTTRNADANAADEAVLFMTTTVTAGTGNDDALSLTTRSARSLLSGTIVMEESPGGSVMRHTHDALGRKIRQSMSEETAFAAASEVHYALSHAGSWYEETSVTGVRTRTELDGFGRAMRRVAMNWLDDDVEREIWRASFDAFGQTLSETTTDHAVPLASGASGDLSLTTRHVYDAWGNRAMSIAPDGVVSHIRVDPIGRTEDRWSEAIGSGARELSEHSHVTFGIHGRPLRIERRDGQGAPRSWRSYTYNGWGHCLSDTESAPGVPDKVTRYRYDDYDRVAEITLADGSVVYRTYAAHSDDELVEATGVRHTPAGEAIEVDVELGRQAFDGLDRRTLFRNGSRETRYVYRTARSGEPDEIHLPSRDILSCTYEKQLGYRLTAITDQARTVECLFEYHPVLGQLQYAANALGEHDIEYLPSGRVRAERFRFGIHDKFATYTYTLLGLPATYTFVDGETCGIRYDECGRVSRVDNDALGTEFAYDAFSRTCRVKTESADGERSMDMSLAYDDGGREIERVLVSRSGVVTAKQALTQAYAADGKLRTRTWLAEDGSRAESYDYDMRGRLVGYACTGSHAPIDPWGFAIAGQRFTFDALDNMLTLETTYADVSVQPRKSSFHYASNDPTQLIRIEHVQGASEEIVRLEYDACGNLKYDEAQRRMEYDAAGRLVRWTRGSAWQDYRYDPLDRVGAVGGSDPTRFRYYRDGQVAWESDGVTSSSFHAFGGANLAQCTSDAVGTDTVLLGSDAQGSVVSEAGAALASPAYGVYGYRPEEEGSSDIAYAGELKERDVGWYLLGSYRVYNPRLMRFHSPDAASPFGHGGLNAYAYVSGDPINRIDPSGEGWLDWAIVGIGAIATAVGVVASMGTLAPAAAALWAGAAVTFTQAAAVVSTGVGVLSVATGVASVALNETGHESEGSVLGWMSLGYGIGSAAVGAAPAVAASRVGRAVASGAGKVRGGYKAVSELPWRLRHAGGKPSKVSAIGSRGNPAAPRGRVNPAFAGEAAERAAPPSNNWGGMTGTERVNQAAQRLSRGLPVPENLVTQRMGEVFPDGISNEWSHVETLLDARRTPSPAPFNQLSQSDLVGSGFTDNELVGAIEGMNVPRNNAFAQERLAESAGLFRRFMQTGEMGALRQSSEALRLARDGVRTHMTMPPRG